MSGYVIPLPPRWERDLETGWVEYKSAGEDIRGYFAKPKDAKDLPAIVLVHENLGVIEHRQAVVRQFAKAGYAAIAVDLYSRIGGQSPRNFSSPEERRALAFQSMDAKRVIGDLEATSGYLAARGDIDPERIGTIGYCSGGGQVFGWVCGNSTAVRCAVVLYGTVTLPAEWTSDGVPVDHRRNAAALGCPIQVHQGEKDNAVAPEQVREMVDGLKQSGQPVEVYFYENGNHAYEDDTHPNFDEDITKATWDRSLEFFGTYLK